MCGHQALGQIIWLLLREYPEAPRLGVSPLKTFFTNRAEILLPAPSSSGIDTFTFYPRQWKKCCFSIFSLCYGRWFLFKLVKCFLNTDCNHRRIERMDELSYLILKWSITCWLSLGFPLEKANDRHVTQQRWRFFKGCRCSQHQPVVFTWF